MTYNTNQITILLMQKKKEQTPSRTSGGNLLRFMLMLMVSFITASNTFAEDLFDDNGDPVQLSALKSCTQIGLSENGSKISMHFLLMDDNVLWFDWGSDGIMDNRQFFPNSSTSIERDGNTMTISNSMGKVIITLVTDPVSKRKFYVVKYNKKSRKSFTDKLELTESQVLAVAYFEKKKLIAYEEMEDSSYPALFDAFDKFIKKCKD